MFSDYVKESSKNFSKQEDNPLIYTPIIVKLIQLGDRDLVKKDEALKKLIAKAEKTIKDIPLKNINALVKSTSPTSVYTMFSQETAKKNLLDFFSTQMCVYKTTMMEIEKSLLDTLDIEKAVKDYLESEEMANFKATL